MTTLLNSPVDTFILVVDDNLDNLKLLAKILESQGYTVRKSLSGQLALQAAQRDPPDLILLDINMPQMNGYEVCKKLKELDNTCQIPIIFVSALNQPDDKVKAFEMGGQDYISKPFQQSEILTRVKNQLLIRQQYQQLQQEILERQRVEAEIRRLNQELEHQVHARTLELQQALKLEITLKRISDKVRDSLDHEKILQNVVEELAIAMDVYCCDAVLYYPDHQSSLIRYQYVASGIEATQGQLLYMSDAPEIYAQLQDQKIYFAFCQIQPLSIRNHSAILACPVFDEQVEQIGILGDLWLFKDTMSSFSEIEIHLVQQVANQCAIALRQARLYEAAQLQVQELERLNQLKDDFLSTISHELRTPISTIKMVTKLLISMMDQANGLEDILTSSIQPNKLTQYFQVLQEECDREIAIIEDLLSLQQIEAGTYDSVPTLICLENLILHAIEPFHSRSQHQNLSLQVNLEPDLPNLNLDPRSLSRIITELLTNACKYTPAGETISISVKIIQDSTELDSTQHLQIKIANTGIEISNEELKRIFDKFYRIPNNDPWKYGGTGLGLALVKKLVENIGGSITATSENNLTCFTVRITVDSFSNITAPALPPNPPRL